MEVKYELSEEWKSVKGYEGEYWVSSQGRVMSHKQGSSRMLKLCESSTGYLHVVLCKRGKKKTIPVHKLVLIAFKGATPVGCEARHMDGNRYNNYDTNLQWGTRSQNSRDKFQHGTDIRGKRNPNKKLSENKVILLKNYLRKGGYSCAELSRKFGINERTVVDIKNGKSWNWL